MQITEVVELAELFGGQFHDVPPNFIGRSLAQIVAQTLKVHCTKFHSGMTFAALMTAAHFSISTGIMAASSAGDLTASVMPCAASTDFAASV
ncbi:MAG TPA: hypothetical protein VGO84_08715, partial [Burkholderiales bacterium]|nr:hypothetical protein [Burkholderiales bacterium]